MNQTPLNPDALEAAARATYEMRNPESWARTWEELEPKEREEEWVKPTRTSTLAYLAVAQPVVNTVEELEALPIGAVVYANNHIGPAERFDIGWMGCGNTAAWSSPVLARDGLPALVLYRPEVKP